MIVLLDAGPLGILSNPNSTPATGDAILAAQASLIAGSQGDRMVVVATTNVEHLERFVNAKYWQAIAVKD